MDVQEKNKKAATFTLKKESIESLKDITKDVNQRVGIRITKSQILDMLIHDAKKRDISRLILT